MKIKINFGDEHGRTVTIRIRQAAIKDLVFEEFIVSLANLLYRHIHFEQKKAKKK